MFSTLKFPPQKLIEVGGNRLLAIGVNGELQIFNEKFESESDYKSPFPSPIVLSTVFENILYACWIDLELLIARMAAINLNSDLLDGPSRSELRIDLTNNAESQVKGAIWSHILDAEPLGLVAGSEYVAFSTWKRGVYCITHNSEELWRIPEIKWLKKLENVNVIASMEIIDEGLLIWSKGAEWVLLDEKSGELLDRGEIEFDYVLEKVFSSEKGRLLCSSEGFVLWLDNLKSKNTKTIVEKGPVHDAKWDSELQCWRICLWRKDILWSETGIEKHEKRDIGMAVFKNNEKWFVLDNSGNCSKHFSKNHSSSDAELP
jgi:hypothetical protein